MGSYDPPMPQQKQEPHNETLFRAFIMGAAIVGLGWAAFRYTEIPRIAIQKAIAWYESRAEFQQTEILLARPAPQNQDPQQPGLLPSSVQHAERLPGGQSGLPAQPETLGIAGQPPAEARAVAFEFPATDRGIANAGPVVERRAAIEQRLAELGAVYSLLETFGRDQRRYRFHCDVTLAGSVDLTRSFEASGSDAVEVMRQVLREVEAWRGPVVPAAW
jgi:hypothetical protein